MLCLFFCHCWHFCRLGRRQPQSLCVHGHATCKVSTRAFGLLSWIRARGGKTILQNPYLLCPWGEWFGRRIRKNDNPTPTANEKKVAPIKGKDMGKNIVVNASAQISTCSVTKALVQCIDVLAIIVVGSPSDTPSALASFHNGDTIPSVPRRGKPSHRMHMSFFWICHLLSLSLFGWYFGHGGAHWGSHEKQGSPSSLLPT